jgi:hypothetical protein
MWSKRLGRVVALFGLYVIVLWGIGTRVAGKDSSQHQVDLIAFAVATVIFVLAAIFIFSRPVRAPLE